MSADKYPCIFSRQMEAIVYIFTGTLDLYIFFSRLTYHITLIFCAVAENFYTHPIKGHWKFRGCRVQRKFLKENVKLYRNFQMGGV